MKNNHEDSFQRKEGQLSRRREQNDWKEGGREPGTTKGPREDKTMRECRKTCHRELDVLGIDSSFINNLLSPTHLDCTLYSSPFDTRIVPDVVGAVKSQKRLLLILLMEETLLTVTNMCNGVSLSTRCTSGHSKLTINHHPWIFVTRMS